MSVNRERNYTFEEIRDKYLYIVYRIHERYNLDEDALADLVIAYCECIQKNLGRTDFYWSGRLQSYVDQYAKRMLKSQKHLQEGFECVPYDTVMSLESYTLEGVENRIASEQLRAVIDQLLPTLSAKEEAVLRMRFLELKSANECCEVFKVGRERIRQIERKALNKMRHYTRRNVLKPFVDLSYQPKEKKASSAKVPAPKKVLVYRAPYELGVPVWQETLGDRTLSIYDREGYVIHLEEGRASWYVNGKTLRTCRLADATRYKTLEDAMVASKVLLSPATSLANGRILIPERVALFPRQIVPEYDVCRIVGTENYVIHCVYFNQHRFLNQGGYKWGPLEDATKFTDTAVPASLIELAYGENEGVVFPVCHF